MAFGPIVKSIFVRMSSSGGPDVKAEMADVAARAAALSKMDPTIKVGIDDKAARFRLKALNLELRALELKGGDQAAFRGLAGQFRGIGADADGARLKAAALNLELRALKNLSAGDQGTGGGGIVGLLAKIGGTNVPLGPLGTANVGTIAGVAAVAPAFGSIISGTLGIIPLLAAAALGVGAFGALAIPTFTAVSGAITKISADTAAYQAATTRAAKSTALANIRADWHALTPVQAQVVRGVQGIQSEFSGLAKVLGPQVLPVFRDLLPGIRQLIGDMGPFAHAVAPVLDSLAKSFSKFTMSPGFKQFLDQMLKLSGPAVLAIGKGIGQVAGALGHLLTAMISPNGLTALKLTFDVISGGIKALGAVVGVFSATGHAVDNVFHALSNVGHAIGNVGRAIGDAEHSISHAGDNISHAIGNVAHAYVVAMNSVISFFTGLPAKITSALSGLPGALVSAGKAAIGGLLSGLESGLPSVLSFAAGIAAKIASLKGPIEKDRMLLVPAGAAIMAGLQAGMLRGRPAVLNVAAILGLQIRDKLMDAFLAGSGKAAGTIAGMIRARLDQIRAVVIGVAQQMTGWASLTSAAQGPAFTNPRWIPGHPGTPGGIVFSHLGGPVVTGPSGAAPGHWAGGVRPPTGAQLLRNLRLDLNRLRAFGHVLGRLRHMGLDNSLIQQLIAAGPDQGYQIAEAILDAGRGEVRALDRTENQIWKAGVGIGRTAARSQFGNGVSVIININGFVAGDKRAIAREIQKLLRDLKRSNGGGALGLA